MSGIKENVSDNLEQYCLKLLELDPKTMNGGGYRINGIMNLKLPYIPFVLPWPDKDKAEEYLRLAIDAFPTDKSSNYFMAELLFEEGRYDEVNAYIQTIFSKPSRIDYWMEDNWAINHAVELAKKNNKKNPDNLIDLPK